jgi:predicted RND superfamily exporter protein
MWQKIGTYVIRNRFWFLVALGIVTLFFGYFATKVQLTYDFAKVIPDNDPDFVEYVKFKQTFGEDGNILAIGIQSNKLYEKDFFNDLIELNNKISETNGHRTEHSRRSTAKPRSTGRELGRHPNFGCR